MIDVTLVPIIPHNENYAFILKADNGDVAVVDPGDAAPIIDVLEAQSLKPDIIIITHHHWDHTDGIPDMLAWHSCPVVGPAKEAKIIKHLDILLDGTSEFSFGGENVQIFETPGHTNGHICFYFPESSFLLAGDTLFSMGCGRLLEGTPEEMWHSLQKLKALPDETLIYCGHEYTLNNGQFCAGIEPENQAITERLEEATKLREQGKATIPMSLKTEKETNLFLRAESVEKFAEIRAKRDRH